MSTSFSTATVTSTTMAMTSMMTSASRMASFRSRVTRDYQSLLSINTSLHDFADPIFESLDLQATCKEQTTKLTCGASKLLN